MQLISVESRPTRRRGRLERVVGLSPEPEPTSKTANERSRDQFAESGDAFSRADMDCARSEITASAATSSSSCERVARLAVLKRDVRLGILARTSRKPKTGSRLESRIGITLS